LVNPLRALAVVTVMMTVDVTKTESRLRPSSRLLLRVTGAGLLIATAAIHLDLYLTGYRTIPTIGRLFLLQVIVGFGAGLLVLATGSRLAAAFGAVFALSTLGGYLLSVQFGLFGFREVRTTTGIVAAVVEVAAFATLGVLAATQTAGLHSRGSHAARASLADRNRWVGRAASGVSGAVAGLGVAAVALVAFGLLGGALAGAGGSAGPGGAAASHVASGGELRTTTIGGVTVLTNAAGRTLYWFGPDTSTRSACTGSCAQYWPPVGPPATAGPGVTGRLATIHRPGGSLQETYNGHPLYTYIADTGPGQARGNNLDLNGGVWHEVVVTG
jgi:predicted lipoprotein with Yx(FWY)xxD motif